MNSTISQNNSKNKKIYFSPWVILFWIALWQIASMIIDESILLASPYSVVIALSTMIFELDFWTSILFTLGMISTGFLIAIALGIALALISKKSDLVRQLLSPLVTFSTSVPIASFIILILIWIPSRYISIIITVIMVFPIVYTNILNSLVNLNKDISEMAAVFKLSYYARLRYVILPQVFPHFISACKISIGLAFKAGIAAEVIGLPDNSIGEQLYQSKIYLDTPNLFAWTSVIILISIAYEKLIILTLNTLNKLSQKYNIDSLCRNDTISTTIENTNYDFITIDNLVKNYSDLNVFDGLNLKIEHGNLTCIGGDSGIGKTTLLRLISNLETYDSGDISGCTNYSMSFVFQEDRLIDNLNVYTNLLLPHIGKKSIKKLDKFLLDNYLSSLNLLNIGYKPVCELSGGMKRRIALLRAIIADYDILFLDEPFKGLDDDTKYKVIDFVKNMTTNKTIIYVSHDKFEIDYVKPNTTIIL